MLKANEFELKLAATQLQTCSFKFINTKIYALSVSIAHSIFARISYINFFVSNVSAQVMEFKEIGEIFVIVNFLEVRMQKFSWVYLQGVERAG